MINGSKKERKAKIIHAAGELFAAYGLRKTSMDDVADAVGLVKGSLYYYFKNKDELFRKVVQAEGDRLIKRLKEAINREKLARNKLRAFLIARIKFFREISQDYPISPVAGREIMPLLEEERHAYVLKEKELLQAILQQGMADGEFAMIDPEFVALTVLAFLRAFDPAVFTDLSRELQNEDYDLMIDLLFHGIVRE